MRSEGGGEARTGAEGHRVIFFCLRMVGEERTGRRHNEESIAVYMRVVGSSEQVRGTQRDVFLSV